MKTKTMNIVNNKLYMGNFSLEELARKYKTPLYVYDEAQILEKIEKYKSDMTMDELNDISLKVCYASKAFIAPYFCRILNDVGFYIDAVSAGDLYLIHKSGFKMEHVILHGNNKSNEELEMAVDMNVGYIVCDNILELPRLEKIAKTKGKIVHTLFRMNPGVEAHTHAFVQTSLLDSKFGESIFDEEKVKYIVEFYKKSANILLDGFHIHIGSQIQNSESFVSGVHVLTDFVKKTIKKYDIKIDTLDFGGGFGIKYVDDDPVINIKDTLNQMIKTCIEDLKDTNIKIKNILIEPGRSIVGDAGVTLYTCGGVKKTYAGVEYAFVDGGMNDNIRYALYDAKYTVNNASCMTGVKNKYNVAGKCCESGDMVAKGVEFCEPKENDILCVFSTGAYCYSMSMNYNGLTRSGVIFVNGDKVSEVIKKESFEELVHTCVFR